MSRITPLFLNFQQATKSDASDNRSVTRAAIARVQRSV